MERFIAQANIERFRRLLAEEIDENSRATLLYLLTREERKLASLAGSTEENPEGRLED